MTEVFYTDEFGDWFRGLDKSTRQAVERGVGWLEARGVALGFPYCSRLMQTDQALFELRVQAGGRPIRVFYAFDPRRDAVLLIGGDKTGDGRFYERMIPQAERIWLAYLREQEAGLHDDEDDD